MTQLETAMDILRKTFRTYAAAEGSKDSLSWGEDFAGERAAWTAQGTAQLKLNKVYLAIVKVKE